MPLDVEAPDESDRSSRGLVLCWADEPAEMRERSVC
jgi:hypothetical protein